MQKYIVSQKNIRHPIQLRSRSDWVQDNIIRGVLAKLVIIFMMYQELCLIVLMAIQYLYHQSVQIYTVAQKNQRHPVQLLSFTDGVQEVFKRKTGHIIHVLTLILNCTDHDTTFSSLVNAEIQRVTEKNKRHPVQLLFSLQGVTKRTES